MKHMPAWGWPLILVFTIIPLVRWSMLYPLSDRFADTAVAATSLGQVTGIAGLMLFGLSLILSARIKLFDDLFGGINRAYIAHHIVGGVSLLVLLVHPLAVLVPYVPTSVPAAASMLVPGADWTLNLGLASLLLLIALLVLTYFTSLPYQVWRLTHKFLGVAFVLGAVHGLLIESDVSRDPILTAYIGAFLIVGMLVYTYRTILGRILVKRYRYRVSGVTRRADTIVQISFVPTGAEAMLFVPGQFVFVELLGHSVPNEPHPFSISSVPTPMGFVLTIKALGDYTKNLATIPLGTQALVEGPYGRFAFDMDTSHEMIWVAGGIGITPFLSMAASMPKTARATLYYTVPTPKEAVYLPDLTALSRGIPGLRVIPWYTKTQGHLTAESIQGTSGELTGKSFFLCGPPHMMHELKRQCMRLGVADRSIHSEEFAMLG